MHLLEIKRDEDGFKQPFPRLHAETAHTGWGTSARDASVGAATAVSRQPAIPAELKSLIDMSARIGGNPLLVQGNIGNTSIKVGGTLWVKASGKPLANPERKAIFVPVDIAEWLE